MREIKILKEIDHPNIIRIRDVFCEKGEKGNEMCIMMDYFDTDLEKLIYHSNIKLSEEDIRVIMKQLVEAVNALHTNYVLHRDIKPSNILLNTDGSCVLTDFGLSRKFAAPDAQLTKNIITRWYRPPEILFGAQYYGEKIDVWSLGCIFAEFFLRKPLFKGDNEIDQMSKIFGIRGGPTKDNWPDADKLPHFLRFEESIGFPLGKILDSASREAVSIIDEMLQLDPKKRPRLCDLLKKE